MRPLVWHGPVFEATGYADEVRGMVAAAASAGISVALRPMNRESPGFRDTLTESHRRVLDRCVAQSVSGPFVQLQHHTLDCFSPASERVEFSIGRSMFETDSLPSHWVAAANALDELWVTGDFNRETFRAAGVRVPMHVIPGGIDSDFFRPSVDPLALKGVRGTVFLSVFEWRLRKGWDVLLRAWADAFSPDDDVTLVLRTYPIGKSDARRNADVINERIDAFLADACGRTRADVAPIVILGDRVAARDLPALYKAADAFVLPTRGEGWGRPFMESMACGVPVIATNWSAHLAFMNDTNSYLVNVDGLVPADSTEVAVYAGQRWAEPSASHLAKSLRRVHADRAEARAIGERARHDMVHEWPWSRASDAIAARLREINAQLDSTTHNRVRSAASGSAARIVVEGGTGDLSLPASNAFAWTEALLSGDVHGAPWVGDTVSWRTIDRGVRPSHGSPRFAAWQRVNRTLSRSDVHVTVLDECALSARPVAPTDSAWVIDVGPALASGVPPHLVTSLRDQADQIVVPHAAAFEACVSIGVDPSRIEIVEPSVDTAVFTPEGAAYRRATSAGTRFLVIGVDRAHRDVRRTIALYERTFTSDDDVVLHVVLPPVQDGDDRAWRNRLIAESVPGRRHPRLPRLLVDADGVELDEMPALYRAADVLLHVGAGTGQGRTLREAMACGRPVVATDVAPASDLIDDRCGWLLPCGPTGSAAPDAVQRVLRGATDPTDRQRRGETARARALTWSTPESQRQRRRDIATRMARCTPRRQSGDVLHEGLQPFALAGTRSVVLLAHADWHTGTAQAVVRTYASAFSSNDDVTLALCLDPAQGLAVEDATQLLNAAMDLTGREQEERPDLLLVTDALDGVTLHRLRQATDIVVAVRDPVAHANARRAQREVIDSLDITAWKSAVARRLGSLQVA